MPDPIYFSKVKLLDGSYAEVKDTVARQAIAGGTHFRGVTTTALADMQTISQVVIASETVTLANGDIVIYERKEFIYAESDGKVHELGDLTGLGSLALKNSATGSYTPAGSVSKPDVDVTPTTATIKEVDQAGSVTPGSANTPTAVSVTPGSANTPTAVTLPTLAMQMGANETLEFVWTAGSVTPGQAGSPTQVSVTPGVAGSPTQVVLPTSKETSVVTGVAAELHETPAFTGTPATIEVS